jgi:hypothetical protein
MKELKYLANLNSDLQQHYTKKKTFFIHVELCWSANQILPCTTSLQQFTRRPQNLNYEILTPFLFYYADSYFVPVLFF